MDLWVDALARCQGFSDFMTEVLNGLSPRKKLPCVTIYGCDDGSARASVGGLLDRRRVVTQGQDHNAPNIFRVTKIINQVFMLCSMNNSNVWQYVYEICLFSYSNKSLFLSYAICGSKFARVIACCLATPSHYPSQCWFVRMDSHRFSTVLATFQRNLGSIFLRKRSRCVLTKIIFKL